MLSLAAIRRFFDSVSWVAVLLAVAAMLAAFAVIEGYRIGRLKNQVAVATTNAAANAEVVFGERRQRMYADEVSSNVAKKQQKLRGWSAVRNQDIAAAAPSDDGPVAPVLRAALDGLRTESNEDRADPN